MRCSLSVVLLSLLCAACGGKEEPKKDDVKKEPVQAKKEPVPAKPETAAPPPVVAPAPVADAPIEIDLSRQGAAWAGWTVTGPAGSALEVNEGTVKDGIAIRWGNGAGAMGFAPHKLDFAAIKQDLAVTGDTKVTKETADLLETTMTMAGTELKCFYESRVVGAATVGCWTVSCVSDDAGLAKAHKICASLVKKK